MSGTAQRAGLRRRSRLTALIAVGAVAGMLGLSYAAVPLYQLFCQVTGYGGTPSIAAGDGVTVGSRVISVRFNADIAPDLPWDFAPAQRRISLRVGEQGLAFYRARNDSAQPVTGQAVFNVTPHKAGIYFTKIDCFCFTEQTLTPGQQVDMPVAFYIDPAIEDDVNLADVTTITLSYTFFRQENDVSRRPAPAGRRLDG